MLERLQDFIPEDCPENIAKETIPLVKERLITLKDFENLTSFFYRDISSNKKLLLIRDSKPGLVKKELQATKTELNEIDQNNWTHENIEQKLRTLSNQKDWNLGQYLMMIRGATTGKKATPPLFETLEVLGKKTTLSRLSTAEAKLS